MHPRFVLALLGLTLIFTTTIYYVRIPSELSSGLSNQSSAGYWGNPNAEFDWCEFNYLSFFYIAEPVNSFSMISFFIVVFRIFSHFRLILRTCSHVHILLIEIVLVAVGSFAFHATLQYRLVFIVLVVFKFKFVARMLFRVQGLRLIVKSHCVEQHAVS